MQFTQVYRLLKLCV